MIVILHFHGLQIYVFIYYLLLDKTYLTVTSFKMKKILRIYLEDNTMKTLAVGYSMTAQNVFSVLARKMKLVDTSEFRLILLTTEKKSSQQRVINHSENLFQLISELTQNKTEYIVYFRDPLTPIRKGDMEVSPKLHNRKTCSSYF